MYILGREDGEMTVITGYDQQCDEIVERMLDDPYLCWHVQEHKESQRRWREQVKNETKRKQENVYYRERGR